jgi:hypothetical protein
MVQQTARLLLAKETSNVRHLLEEGIIQPKDADQLFQTIQRDYLRLDTTKFETTEIVVAETVHNRLSMHMSPDQARREREQNVSDKLDDNAL